MRVLDAAKRRFLEVERLVCFGFVLMGRRNLQEQLTWRLEGKYRGGFVGVSWGSIKEWRREVKAY